MNVLNKLERKFGRYAVRDLMKYISILYIVGVAVQLFAPGIYFQYLSLDAEKICQGQIWRIATFLIYPPIGGAWIGMGGSLAGALNLGFDLFFNVLIIYCYRNLGAVLERMWGSFRFNLYIVVGVVGHVLASLIIYLVFHDVYIMTTEYLNFSLFLVIALLFPETSFYIYGLLPIKAKWLALFDCLLYGYIIVFGGAADRIAVIISLLNVILFLGMTGSTKYSPKEIKRKQQFKSKVNQAVHEVERNGRHRCAVCGRTELDNPELTFRYCSKCEGDLEYCQDHLYTHQHVTRGGMDPRQAAGYENQN